VRGLLASLPSDTAVLLFSLLALATLLRASRRVPLNSAFTRRPAEGEKELRENDAPDRTESEEIPRSRTLRRV
jgi:hypothetical protein